MLVLAMQFSRGRRAPTQGRDPERNKAPVQADLVGGLEGHSFRAEQRTERSPATVRWEETPTTTTLRQTTQLANASTGNPLPEGRIGLLRKEVIQPHLPVRLPCYDFTPIADPTFDSSPPCGLGHWLRVLPTFVV